MLLSRGAQRTARCLHNGKGRPWKAPEQRKLSSLLPARRHPGKTASSGLSQNCSPLLQHFPPPSIFSHSSIRFASTAPSPAPLSSTAAPPLNTVDPTPTTRYDTFLPDDPLLANNDLLPPIQEKIGFLHDLGITFGYGPTSTVQWLLEHVYVYSGFGWAPSIIVTAFILRVSFLKLFYNAADMGGKLTAISPVLRTMQERVAEAKRSQDQLVMMEAAREIRQTYKDNGIKFRVMMYPLLVQLPLGFGTFRILRSLAELPAPGLEDESFLWLTDLTVSDPFLILPLATSAAFYVSFKLNGDMQAQTSVTNQSTRIIMQYVLPVISGTFMLFWPGCMQLSFFTSSMFSLLQAYLFRQPVVRSFLRMSPIVRPPKPTITAATNPMYLSPTNPANTTAAATTTDKKGLWGGAYSEIKGAVNQLGSDAKRKLNERDGLGENSRLTRRELKDAKAYEQRRRREVEAEAEMKQSRRKSR